MSSPDHPTHPTLLSKDYHRPYSPRTSSATLSSTTLSNPTGTGKYIHAGEGEWDDNVEKIGTLYDFKSRVGLQTPHYNGPPGTLSILRISCYILHLLMVVAHCALLVACIRGLKMYEVSVGHQTNILSVGNAMLSQAFTIVYLTLLVYITQQLSLRRNLSIKQTLTAVHDKSTAWTGLGSATASLWSQMAVRASVGGVAIIALYLVGVATLKVTTPSLVSVVSFNKTVVETIQTDIGSPFIMVPRDLTFVETSSALPFISQLPTTGLSGNVLFDVLKDNHGIGNTTVNTTTIEVHCGLLEGVEQYAKIEQRHYSMDSISDPWYVSLPIQELDRPVYYSTFMSTMAINTLQILTRPETADKITLPGPNIIIIASTNVVDSQDRILSSFSLKDAPMISGNGTKPIYNLQAIGCSLSITNQTGQVDTQSKQLLTPPAQKTESAWSQWWPKPDTEPWLVGMWLEFMTTGLASHLTTTGESYYQRNDFSNMIIPPYLSVTEVAIMADVGLLSSGVKTNPGQGESLVEPERIPVKLHNLENALATVTASLFWSAGNIEQSEVQTSQGRTGAADIQRSLLKTHIKLNRFPIIVGLSASIILLVLATCMVGFTDNVRPAVENVGILHMFWMSTIGFVAQERIARVDKPTTRNLREAGMFEIRLADGNTHVDADTGSLMKTNHWDR